MKNISKVLSKRFFVFLLAITLLIINMSLTFGYWASQINTSPLNNQNSSIQIGDWPNDWAGQTYDTIKTKNEFETKVIGNTDSTKK